MMEQEARQVKLAGQENEKKRKEKNSEKIPLDNFGGESLPTTAEILSSTRLIETDTGPRLPTVSYRIPMRNFLQKTLETKSEILKGRGIKINFLCVLDQVIVVHTPIHLKISILKKSH